MIDGALMDKLENIARIIRKNKYPFGGIQLVITGDFHQLPPGKSSFQESILLIKKFLMNFSFFVFNSILSYLFFLFFSFSFLFLKNKI